MKVARRTFSLFIYLFFRLSRKKCRGGEEDFGGLKKRFIYKKKTLEYPLDPIFGCIGYIEKEYNIITFKAILVSSSSQNDCSCLEP